jgi:citrate lyase beta subunit
MTYIRSALLISEQESLDFDEATSPDVIVFDLSSSALATLNSLTVKRKISQLTGGMSPLHHVRLTVSTSSNFRSQLNVVFSSDISSVWIAGISEAQQVRDADVEVRRLEMEHGIKPGTISLIPELNTVYPISVLDGILTAADRVVGVALDLDFICADFVVANSNSSDDLFLQRHILTDVAMRAAAHNFSVIVTNSDVQLSIEKIKMIASTGGTGMLTRDVNSVSSLNHEFKLSRAVIERAQTISEQWSNNTLAAQENGIMIQALKRARYLVDSANKIDAG